MAQTAFAEDAQETAGGAPSPPYISFLTLINCLDWLATERVPHRFDRSFWSRKFSGSVGSQLLTALRFLRLLKGDVPEKALDDLANSKGEDRKRLLTEVLRNAYTKVDFNLLDRATPKMLQDWMSEYSGIQGETQRKAESFLINALKYVGVPLSPALQRSARNRPSSSSSGGANRTAKKPKPSDTQRKSQQDEVKGAHEHKPPTTIKELKLNSGGEVLLKISVNLFELSEDDREFVLGLIDAFRDYPENLDNDEDEEDED